MHRIVTTALLTLLVTPALAQAPTQAPAQIDIQGNIRPGVIASPLPSIARACLQLYADNVPATGVVIFTFDVFFRPNMPGFPIVGGKVSGSICNASEWRVTGGHLGPDLRLTATRPEGGACVTGLTVGGTFENPTSYTGTFTTSAPDMNHQFHIISLPFPHHTLFLGYQRATCP